MKKCSVLAAVGLIIVLGLTSVTIREKPGKG